MCKFWLLTPLLFLPTSSFLTFSSSTLSGHGAIQVIGKTGRKSEPLLYVAKASCQLCGIISLVRQATASGSTTGLQELQELPRNLPIQMRRSAINLW